MARPRRHVAPGQPLHIIQRGNNRTMCFLTDADFRFYLEALHRVSQRARCAIHAYVLMGNHAHMLVTPRDAAGPARMMQELGRRFVGYFNRVHARTGTLWEGRYRSCVVDSTHYFFACSRYIEMNPVRAGLVATPAEYRWTSFHRNAFGNPDRLVTPHPEYLALGNRGTAAQVEYRAMFAQPFDPAALQAIRRASNAGRALRESGVDDRARRGPGLRSANVVRAALPTP